MENRKLFAEKVCLVTGASSGIGQATAIRLAEEGADLLITGRNADKLEKTADRIRPHEVNVLAVPGDLKDPDFRVHLADKTRKKFGRLDVLVHAAGIIGSGSLESTSLEEFEEMLNINTTGVFHLTRLLLPMLKDTLGNIVNVSSVTGLRAFPGLMAYCVSKAALDQMTRCAALELAPFGVRVNAVNPGVVITNLHRAGGMNEDAYGQFLKHSETTHPLGRVGRPGEVAELILFLASPNAGWITGTTMSIDGGRAQTCAR